MTTISTTRRTMLQTTAAGVALSVLTGCGRGKGPSDVGKMDPLEGVADKILSYYPESASGFGLDKGDHRILKGKLTDRSAAGQARIASDVKATLADFKKVDRSALEEEDILNLDVVQTVYELTDEGFQFPYGDVAMLNSQWSYRNTPYAIAQNVGAFVEIPSFMDSSHQIENEEDADFYLSRLKAYAEQLDGETERSRADGEKGVILPDFLMAKTIGQLEFGLSTPITEWGIVKSLSSRTADMGDIYAETAQTIAKDSILPAMQRQKEMLEGLASNATSDAGVWKLPDGDAYYDWALRAGTTTTMTPDEVHEMGRDELASLHAQMDPILRDIGYTEGSVGARMTALSEDPRYQFSDGDKGREEIIAFIEGKLDEIKSLMPQAFETLVPGFVEVTRIPPEVEAGAPGAYGGAGTVDGKHPGHFWINLRTPKLHSKFSLPDLTYHEAIPGHVWQGEYTFKQPMIRSLLMFNAYSEGWALYAEQLADELGVYDDFPVGRLGYLQSLAFRACRLVVDTGLHAKRWTREQGVEWFVTQNGSNPEEVASEVDRYCAWPGQACGYKVGHTAINTLRQKAKAELGEKFDFRRFNDALVLGGSVPMTVLGRVIDDYISREGK